ncbi:pilus assembly protein [Candidatus Thiosymbion oneisti]|uniref:pilus assembly protein n=1 Tax=Candidatus Thiosymbion oneisti TaxID=589554 RepID=UPI000A68B650|nr:PilC/PilY family type IV pilus protein [Candidatus Thiosymbion oneisti]
MAELNRRYRYSGTAVLVALFAAALGRPAVAQPSLPVSDPPAFAPAAARDSQVPHGDQGRAIRHGGSSQDCGKLPSGLADSDPVYVHNPDFGYARLLTDLAARDSYQAYRASNRGRRKMLYLSTNDGRLQAFDADTGSERFVFIPTRLPRRLPDPTSPGQRHKHSPNFGDAYIDGAWRTVLIGSPGAQGKSVFALDITTPDGFSKQNLLWERTDAELPHLGYPLHRGTVARMRDGTWAAVFGNGYDSAEGRAVLYVLDVSDGTLLAEIATGAADPSTTPNGLAAPALLADNRRTILAAYAGDLHGNLWKFDLSHTQPERWKVAYGSRENPQPLFRAMDDAGNPQPITLEPEIGQHPTGAGYLIYFGTGRHSGAGAGNLGPDPAVQSFYGIRDQGTPVTSTGNGKDSGPHGSRSRLQRQTITYEVTIAGNHWRVMSDNPIDWTTRQGWFLDLVSPNGGKQGEHLVGTPRLRGGHIRFTTRIPANDRCKLGGQGWAMVLDIENGRRIGAGRFHVSGDGERSDADFLKIPAGPSDATPVTLSARASGADIAKTPHGIPVGAADEHTGGSTTAGGTGRRSWRQLR